VLVTVRKHNLGRAVVLRGSNEAGDGFTRQSKFVLQVVYSSKCYDLGRVRLATGQSYKPAEVLTNRYEAALAELLR